MIISRFMCYNWNTQAKLVHRCQCDQKKIPIQTWNPLPRIQNCDFDEYEHPKIVVEINSSIKGRITSVQQKKLTLTLIPNPQSIYIIIVCRQRSQGSKYLHYRRDKMICFTWTWKIDSCCRSIIQIEEIIALIPSHIQHCSRITQNESQGTLGCHCDLSTRWQSKQHSLCCQSLN